LDLGLVFLNDGERLVDEVLQFVLEKESLIANGNLKGAIADGVGERADVGTIKKKKKDWR
jgi:hypothetical protein